MERNEITKVETPQERRKNLLPIASKVLDRAEIAIMTASTTQTIAERGVDASKELAKLLTTLSVDLGCKYDKNTWQYTCARLIWVIQNHFSQLSTGDVRIAFELLVVGGLDIEMQDSKCYGILSSQYISRVLNAYLTKRNDAIAKAYDAQPPTIAEPKNDVDSNEYWLNRLRDIYGKFKETQELDYQTTGLHIIYEWLVTHGYANEVVPLEEDRKRAFSEYRRMLMMGEINKLQGAYIVREGKDSRELDYPSYIIARNKEIKRAFKEMKEKEVVI